MFYLHPLTLYLPPYTLQAGYWGLSSSSRGCIQCDCNIGGSVGISCRNSDGQCQCRPGIVGRTCDRPGQNKFIPNLGYIIMEAEFATGDIEGVSGNSELLHFARGSAWNNRKHITL